MAFKYALKPFKINVTIGLIEELRGCTQKELFCNLLKKADAKAAQKRLKEASVQSVSQVRLHDGILPVLQMIIQKDLPMGIWTGRDHATTVQILEHLDLASKFSRVVAGCNVKRNKPAPEGLQKLVQHFNCGPGNVLMIGDHAHDIQGAKEAGCQSALALWGQSGTENKLDVDPDMVFASTRELELYLLNVIRY